MKAFVMRQIGSVGCSDKPVPNGAIVRTTRALMLNGDVTLPTAIKVTKPGGTMPNYRYGAGLID